MEVILAKSAGFCFGVRRAVNEVYRCLEEEKDTPIYTFGPIIHNDEVVNDLKNKGVQVVDTLESLAALKKGIVIIRSHGVGRDTETKMRELGMRVIDMTCPFVKKIHRLVEEKSKEGYQIVIAGNPVHPEVVGIVGWSTDGASVVKDAEEAQKLVLDPKKSVFVAAQTTFHYIKFQNIVDQLEKKEYNINCVNTICNATRNRQEEAARLAASVDGMLVIGGSHINYGVREFGMCAIMNGIALYGGFIPYGATFLTFADYGRNALRMAALMKLRSIFVFTHDSIGVGEDGPTHQPIEQTESLRIIPNMDVWRPADTCETLTAWACAISRQDGPSSLIFSRQNLPFVERDEINVDDMEKGGYIMLEAPNGPSSVEVTLVATGSEVALAAEARKQLLAMNIQTRLVSMPSTTVFDRQDKEYRDFVLGEGRPVVAIEAGRTDGWWKYIRGAGTVIGLDRFGESAPASELFKLFGFTVDNVVETVQHVLSQGK